MYVVTYLSPMIYWYIIIRSKKTFLSFQIRVAWKMSWWWHILNNHIRGKHNSVWLTPGLDLKQSYLSLILPWHRWNNLRSSSTLGITRIHREIARNTQFLVPRFSVMHTGAICKTQVLLAMESGRERQNIRILTSPMSAQNGNPPYNYYLL